MSDVPIYRPDDEAAAAIARGAIDFAFLRGLLPTLDPMAIVKALLQGGVPAVIAYLKAEFAKTPNPLDDMCLPWIAQAVEALIAKWLVPEPQPIKGDEAEAFGDRVAHKRKQIEDKIRQLGGDPAKFNPVLIQMLLILAWPIVDKLLEKWLKT